MNDFHLTHQQSENVKHEAERPGLKIIFIDASKYEELWMRVEQLISDNFPISMRYGASDQRSLHHAGNVLVPDSESHDA